MSVEPSIKSERDTFLAAKRSKKISESLATIGRVYGNNISKINVMKPLQQQHQSVQELRKPWVSSSKTDAREYGDYYSWQARLSYLETQRINITASKGIEPFIDEYMKKLFRCQMFERGHNVEPFASARLEVLNRSGNANNSKMDVIDDSNESFVSNRYRREAFTSKGYRKNTKSPNVPVVALKTIEMIRKHKNGQPIADELEVTNRKRISVGNDRILNRQQVITTAKNRSSSSQNQKISSKQNKSRSDMNVGNTSASGLNVNRCSRATSQNSLVRPSVKQNKSRSSVVTDIVNSIDQRNNSTNKSDSATNRTSSTQNQKISSKRNKGRTSVTTGEKGCPKQRTNSDDRSDIDDNANSNTSGHRRSETNSTKNVNSSIENQSKQNKSRISVIAGSSGQSSSKSDSTINFTSTIRVETISTEQNRDPEEMSVIFDNANSTTNNNSSMQNQTVLPKQNKSRIGTIISNVLKKNKSAAKRSFLLQNDNQKQNENAEKRSSVTVTDTAKTRRSRGSKSGSIISRYFTLQNQETLTEENENFDESNGNADTVSRGGHDGIESGVSTTVTSSVQNEEKRSSKQNENLNDGNVVADSSLKVTELVPESPS